MKKILFIIFLASCCLACNQKQNQESQDNKSLNIISSTNSSISQNYMIIDGSVFSKKNEFLNKVNNAIKEGYKPIGGVCVTQGGDAYQAMVK